MGGGASWERTGRFVAGGDWRGRDTANTGPPPPPAPAPAHAVCCTTRPTDDAGGGGGGEARHPRRLWRIPVPNTGWATVKSRLGLTVGVLLSPTIAVGLVLYPSSALPNWPSKK